jgi:L-threonylcarbamoyladenylate synthase
MVFDDKMHEVIGSLENDGIILYPTDTVWALGCSIKSQSAISKIRHLKSMGKKPMVTLASSIEMLKKYIPHIHPRVETLLSYHKKPLTIVYPKPRNLPEHIIAEDNTIAIRIPDDEFCKTLIDLLGHPIVSTLPIAKEAKKSINYNDIPKEFLDASNYICYHRRNIISNTLPSIIVKYDMDGELDFIRL